MHATPPQPPKKKKKKKLQWLSSRVGGQNCYTQLVVELPHAPLLQVLAPSLYEVI